MYKICWGVLTSVACWRFAIQNVAVHLFFIAMERDPNLHPIC